MTPSQVNYQAISSVFVTYRFYVVETTMYGILVKLVVWLRRGVFFVDAVEDTPCIMRAHHHDVCDVLPTAKRKKENHSLDDDDRTMMAQLMDGNHSWYQRAPTVYDSSCLSISIWNLLDNLQHEFPIYNHTPHVPAGLLGMDQPSICLVTHTTLGH